MHLTVLADLHLLRLGSVLSELEDGLADAVLDALVERRSVAEEEEDFHPDLCRETA